MEEHLTFNQGAEGSSPSTNTKQIILLSIVFYHKILQSKNERAYFLFLLKPGGILKGWRGRHKFILYLDKGANSNFLNKI